MEDKLEQVAAQVGDLSKQLSGVEARLTTAMTDLLKTAMTELNQQARINIEDLKQQARINVEDLKQQARINVEDLKQQARINVEDLKQHGRINIEEVKQEVRLLGDGYVATLEGIERQLSDLNKKVDTKFGDHELVLDNHNTRISQLERRT